MTFTVKTKAGTLPEAVRQQAGIKIGDMLDFKVSGGVVTVFPKLPTADDEYTPEQRRTIDARLDKAEVELNEGHVSPAFETVEEFTAALKADARKLKVKTKRSPKR
jgi:bifunctional DNA-binding transcriptional regulator/antitoxin component of YhaV-PrlF toxin-antitoxin module